MHAYFGKTTGCDWDANYCSVWYSTSDMLHVYLLKYAKYSHIRYASAVVRFSAVVVAAVAGSGIGDVFSGS